MVILMVPSAGFAAPICYSETAVCAFLKQQDSLGLAAGNIGDFYQNLDDGHAVFNPYDLPQVTVLPQVLNSPDMEATPDKVLIGNASRVYTILGTVSLNRFSLMNGQAGADIAYQQYRANNTFWYPEHADHDVVDKYHAMQPQPNDSQGSSGSELDELDKMFTTLAAFRPDTKTILKQYGLLMPTLQMIFRRTRVGSDAEYLSGKAHQNAYDDFDGWMAMAQMANGILAANVPPMIQLQVISDTFDAPDMGRTTFNYSTTQSGGLQRLYDTPTSIARIWKDFDYTKRVRVSARGSFDVNNRPLTYAWAILRGDPAHVRIIPQSADNADVEIEIDYPEEQTIQVQRLGDTAIKSSLVVVGAFVTNGQYYSAPGFVTAYSVPIEQRTYDSNGRLSTIHFGPLVPDREFMTQIGQKVAWESDTFRYDPQGHRAGWTRSKGGQLFDFTREGYQVLTKDSGGNPTQVQPVFYMINGSNLADWTLTGSPFSYSSTNQPPTAVLSSPAGPATITAGNPLTVSVTASDSDGTIQRIEYIVNGQRQSMSTTPPFAWIWTPQTPGTYDISARAFDSMGGIGDTAHQLVTVQPIPTGPVITSSQPSGNLPSGTSQTTLAVMTDRAATCRYETASNTKYVSMTHTFSVTGNQLHQQTINSLVEGGNYSYFVRCSAQGVDNTSDYAVRFSVGNPTSSLPPPDLASINGRVFTINDTIRIPYGGQATGFLWTLTPVATAAPAAQALPLEPNAGSIAAAPVPTAVPALPLTTLGLTLGVYDISMAAQNGSLTSATSHARITIAVGDLSTIRVYPNPWRRDRHAGSLVTFGSLPPQSQIQVFTISGRLVRDLGTVSGSATWDLRNDAGESVASGVYLYLIKDGSGARRRGKFAVMR